MNADNLTYLQKVALKGDIAHALVTCSHDADIKFRLYMILKSVAKELRPFVLEALKEAVLLNEDELNRVYFETLTDEVPVWLWTDKVIADIKKELKNELLTQSISKISIDKNAERKKLIESAFISLGRRAVLVSPEGSKALIDKVLEDDELSFLSTACFYLKELLNDFVKSNKVSCKEISKGLLKIEFDINIGISSTMDIPLPQSSNEEEISSSLEEEPDEKAELAGSIIIEGSISPDELSQFLSQKITELLQNKSEQKERNSANIKYEVQKVFLDSQIKTDIITCNSEEEAKEFIKRVKHEYPELESTCDFIIVKKVQ